ncbi:MAG: PqqD family protein [Gemmatimonadaceae bacterium]
MIRYRISGDALTAMLSDGAVLLNLHSKRYFSLNETGTRVWALLEHNSGLDEIVQTLTAEYDVAESDARREVMALVEELLREGLLV